MPIFLAASFENLEILVTLFLILACAKLFAESFERLKQPAVAGEILAGIIIGPSVLALVEPSELLSVLAEIGIIFLLFNVGLEIKPQSILQVGKRAVMVGVLGVITPFIAGYFVAHIWGGSFLESMFIGAALVATSVGITARVLGSMGLIDTEASRIILGAAVIDDILGLLILSVVSSISKGDVNYLTITKTATMAVVFIIFVVIIGSKLMKRLIPKIERLHISKPYFNIGLILCLGLSVLAVYIQVAAIIGAFLAGMLMSEVTEKNPKMHHLTNGVTEFLVPFFLVNIGMQLDLNIFRDSNAVIFAIVITIIAVATKLLGCGLGAYAMGLKKAAQVGIGMVPRGEVGIVVAQIGLGLAVLNEKFFGAVLFMAIATTLIAPPFIRLLFADEKDRQKTDFSETFSRIG